MAALCAGTAFSASAATTIYDNSQHDLLTRFSPGIAEAGDQIVLADPGARLLTKFSFEYYGLNSVTPGSFSGSINARVCFYLNDGPLFNGYATPGTMFYDSGLFAVGNPTTRNTFVFTAGADFPAGGLFVPGNEMTWSVQFSGMGANDEVGVDIYNPVVVGQNYPDYWQNSGGGWSLMTNSVPMNFAAYMEAIPEPSGVALTVMGLGILAVVRWRRNAA